jgi:hypothetical protein
MDYATVAGMYNTTKLLTTYNSVRYTDSAPAAIDAVPLAAL